VKRGFHRQVNNLLPADCGDQRAIQGRSGRIDPTVDRVRKIARTRSAGLERLAGRFCAPYDAAGWYPLFVIAMT
jgi:hypothetical protein